MGPIVRRRPAPQTVAAWGLIAAGNLGNDASFVTFADFLRRRAPGVDLRIVSTHPREAGARYGVATRPLDAPLGGPLHLPRPIAKAGGRIGDLLRAFFVTPRAADVIVVPGMGVMEDSMYVNPLGFPLLMALTAAGCRMQGRRFVLLDIGAEFAQSRLTRRIFAWCLRLAADVSVRDELSAAVVESAGRDTPAPIAPDLAFGHPRRELGQPSPDRIVVGVISAAESLGARGQDYEAKMVQVVRGLLDQGLEVVLVGGDAGDLPAARAIATAARAGGPAERLRVETLEEYAELLAVMSTAAVVLASRYHNLVAALQVGRPTYSIGYAEKCALLLRRAGLEEFSCTLNDFEPARVVDAVLRLRSEQSRYAELVARRTGGFAAQVEGLLEATAEGLGLPRMPAQK